MAAQVLRVPRIGSNRDLPRTASVFRAQVLRLLRLRTRAMDTPHRILSRVGGLLRLLLLRHPAYLYLIVLRPQYMLFGILRPPIPSHCITMSIRVQDLSVIPTAVLHRPVPRILR